MSTPALPRCLFALLVFLAFLSPALPAAAHTAAPDVTDEIAAGWRSDPIYLYEGLRPVFPKAELDRIRVATRTLKVPVYVALLPDSSYTNANRVDLPTLLQARIGGDGLFLVWVVTDDYWRGTAELVGSVRGRGGLSQVRVDDKRANDLRTDLPAPRIVRTIQQAATALDGRALPEIPATDLEEQDARSPDELSTSDKKDLAAYIGMGLGGLAGLALVIALWSRSRSRSGRQSPARKPFGRATPRSTGRSRAVPPAPDRAPMSVYSVRERAEALVEQAQRTLQKLEARISSAPADRPGLSRLLDQRDDAGRRLEAARLLLAGPVTEDGLTAAAGAFVLGRQAQEVAAGGAVTPPCFFNPLHNAGSTQVEWADTEVPACRACVRVLRRDGRPDTFLVWQQSGLFGADRRAVDYWHLDPEDDPLAAAGFGALGDDVPERIVARYGGTR